MATNFLHATGTNGALTAAFQVIGGAELNALANAGVVVGSTSGSSGVFTQSNFASGQYGYFYATTGASSGWTPTAGGNLTGWFMHSPDGGTTYETTVGTTGLARPPDFIISLAANALPASSIVGYSSLVPMPYDTCKFYIQNNSGATTASVSNTIKCFVVADQY